MYYAVAQHMLGHGIGRYTHWIADFALVILAYFASVKVMGSFEESYSLWVYYV